MHARYPAIRVPLSFSLLMVLTTKLPTADLVSTAAANDVTVRGLPAVGEGVDVVVSEQRVAALSDSEATEGGSR